MQEPLVDATCVTWCPTAPMTIAHVTALFHAAQQALTANAGWRIDLSGVERIDTAGCQLLMRFRIEAQRAGCSWDIRGIPQQVRDVAALLGCADAIGLTPADGQREKETA